MQVSAEILTVHTKHPFVIARGGTSVFEVVWIRVRDRDGAEGWGEAAPSAFYGETVGTVLAALERFRGVLEGADSWSLEAIEDSLQKSLRWNASARVGLSAALHDLNCKRLGVPIWRLWGLSPEKTPLSSFTIAITPDEETLIRRVKEAAGYPILKVKLGGNRDRATLKAVREHAPHARIRVDANAAWTPHGTLEMMTALTDAGVELLEQPLPPHDLAGLRFVRERSPIPVFADESCIVATDIPPLSGVVDGINIKLAKCGSLREALRMIATARSCGLSVMCGCMIESTLGIAAAAQFSPLLDHADLDGAALLADDPFIGPGLDGEGRIRLGEEPGLGVTRRQ